MKAAKGGYVRSDSVFASETTGTYHLLLKVEWAANVYVYVCTTTTYFSLRKMRLCCRGRDP